jgi:undecaprenyl diphosphate synthase
MTAPPVATSVVRNLTHVAIIMDGNGRWAKGRLLPRIEGHRAGAKTVRMVVEESRRLGVRYLTLFTFSTENWRRPVSEVGALMQLFAQYLESELDLLLKNGIRLRSIGDRSRLPEPVQNLLSKTEKATEKNTGMDLILALSYGGREEIASAARRIAEEVKAGSLSAEQINEDTFRNYLYAPDVPDVDLLVRTSDEFRISNFLLWQLAYSEMVVTPVAWPEFGKDEFLRCIEEYGTRVRRFGLTDEQREGG